MRSTARPTWSHRLDRWMYQGGRPNRLARILNWLGARQYAAGIAVPKYLVTRVVPVDAD